MTTANKSRKELLDEIESLRLRLEEAEETLAAIGSGEVDALVVSGQIFTLRGAERSYRILVETMNEGAITLDFDGTILYCNNRLATMLQVPLEKLIGTQLGAYVSPADYPFITACQEKCSPDFAANEITMITGRGTFLPVLISCCVNDFSGSSGISVVVTDLTQQKRSEEIMASERLASSIIEQAEEAIVVCDEEGRIIRASRSAHQLCGENPLLKPFNEVFPLLIIETGCFFSNLPPLHYGSIKCVEVEFNRSDNRTFHLILNATPLKSIQNHFMGCVVTLTDFTEHKRVEDEIKKLNVDLSARTSELENANQELAAFNFMASHDLGQPLNNIYTSSQAIELLCGDKLDEESKEFLQIIKSSAKNMNYLIEALLRFSQSDHAELFRIMVDLSDMARVVAAGLKLNEPDRRVEIKIEKGLIANGDPDLLRVVLNKLFSNAWKYTGNQKQAIIEFGAMECDSRPTYFIRDNGPGFDMQETKDLFLPFNRRRGGGEFTGHGIGLATAERIIRRHGGKIWALGEPGKGATFFFTLGE